MTMTPRRIMAWLYFLQRYQARRRAETLSTGALAARGEPRKLKSAIEAALKGQ
jgi:hypothetical protein